MSADFETWLEGYMKWREGAARVLGRSIPIELAKLQQEQQDLEPMLDAAESHKANAEFYERLAIDNKLPKRARIVWAVADTAGRCRVISSRSMKVAQQLKLQDAGAPGRR